MLERYFNFFMYCGVGIGIFFLYLYWFMLLLMCKYIIYFKMVPSGACTYCALFPQSGQHQTELIMNIPKETLMGSHHLITP